MNVSLPSSYVNALIGAYNLIPDPILITDAPQSLEECTILAYNNSFTREYRQLAYEANQPLTMLFDLIQGDGRLEPDAEVFYRGLVSQSEGKYEILSLQEGSAILLRWSAARSAYSGIQYMVHTLTNVSDLYELANLDPLTKVNNRRSLLSQGEKEFEQYQRYGQQMTALMLDIDFFKSLNDTYGHSFGDDVLVSISSLLAGDIRDADIIGRYGGEEFVILLPHIDIQGAYVIAERLRNRVEHHELHYEGNRLNVTISIGLADISPETKDLSELIKNADSAMYLSKQAGRNRVTKFSR